jgi:hypothetical protein
LGLLWLFGDGLFSGDYRRLAVTLKNLEELVPLPPLPGSQDAHRFSILGNGPASCLYSHFVQHLHNIQIAIGLSRVFRFDDFPDVFPYAFRSDGLSIGRVDGTIEKELQFKDTLRRVDPFVRCGPV